MAKKQYILVFNSSVFNSLFKVDVGLMDNALFAETLGYFGDNR